MVESSKKVRIDFRQISDKDIRTYLQSALKESQRIIFWKTLSRFNEGKIIKIDQGSKIEIFLKCQPVFSNLKNEFVNLNFQFKELDLFGRGKILNQNDELQEVCIEIDENFFKVENRNMERVQLYPKHESFIYFIYQSNEPKNVLSFKPDTEHSFLEKLSNNYKEKIKANIENSFNSEDEILGFRIDELTANGLSLFCTESEKELIFMKNNTKLNASLLFDGKTFEMKNCQLIYSMDYLSPEFKNIEMLKVGLRFDYNEKLQTNIEKKFDVKLEVLDYKKEFEEYLKNEN